jgi:hypothetical protein
MSIIYEHTSRDSCEEFSVALDEHRTLNIGITPEGIIMDVFGTHAPETEAWTDNETGIDASLLGTVGMMFDEWADWLVERYDHPPAAGDWVWIQKHLSGVERGQELLDRDFLVDEGEETTDIDRKRP